MKIAKFRFLSLILLSTSLAFQANAQTDEMVSVLNIPKYSVDFGTVVEGKKVTGDFQIENKGNAPLNIINFIPNCGCLIPKLDSKTIEPGASLPVQIEFDTRGFAGEQSKQVVFNTDNLDQKQVVFTLKGSIEPELRIEPRRIFLPQISAKELEQLPDVQFTATVNPKSKATITDILDLSQLIEIKNLKITAKKATFSANYLLAEKSGLVRDRLTVVLKDANRKSYNIPVFVKIEDQLELIPPALSFGLLEGEKPVTKKLKIKFQKDLKLKITEIESNNPAISAVLDTKSSDDSLLLLVTIDPQLVQANILSDLILTTNQEKNPEIRVNVFATIPPVLED